MLPLRAPAWWGRPTPRGRCACTVVVLLAFLTACGGSRPSPDAGSGRKTTTSTENVTTPASTVPSADWTTYGGSFTRTSADTVEPPLSGPPTEKWTSPELDGPVYGEPLIYGGQVLVATENDTVYGLSADSGGVEWSEHLGTPVPSKSLSCGDISPIVGITSTMVIDPTTGMLYVSGETARGGSVVHSLYALDLSTHALTWTRDVDQPGWAAGDQLQRSALALDEGRVLLGFGGNYGDCGRYHGWVVAVPESGTGAESVYQVPTANEGAIWGPAGPAVDSAGDIFVATGNGSAGAGQPFDHGDAVIELSPSLAEQQYFAPANWAQDNAQDLDLGSTSPVLLGGGMLFEVGKQATGYLLEAASLGGVGARAPSISLCNSRGATAFASGRLYVVCPDSGSIEEVRVGPGDTLSRGWRWVSPTGGASSPTVARGSVWVVDPGASVLYGLDPVSGATRFSEALRTGTPPHFAAVSAGGGLVVVGGAHGVEAFG